MSKKKSKLTIIDCEQGSPEWFQARLGIPTASKFGTIIGIKKDAREKLTRTTYMKNLAGEIITGQPMDSYVNAFMERGTNLEAEARSLYELVNNCVAQRVGFIRNGDKGCSPDSLLGTQGMLEIKVKIPRTLIDWLELGPEEFPPEHKAQTQGGLWVAEREWVDLMGYCPGMKRYIRRAFRDEAYIKELEAAVRDFNIELADMVERHRP